MKNKSVKEVEENVKIVGEDLSMKIPEVKSEITNKEMCNNKKKAAKYKIINKNKLRNKAIEEERKLENDKKKAINDFLDEHNIKTHKPMNKSQLESKRIISDAKNMGIVLSEKEVRMI